MRWQFVNEAEDESRRIIEQWGSNPQHPYGYGHEVYLRGVIDAIREKRPFDVEGSVGRESLRIVDAIYASAEQGREIRLDQPWAPSRLGKG